MVRFAATLAFLAGSASMAFGVDKEIVQMQREVSLLGQSVDTLQRSVDERLGAALALLKQTLARVNQVYTANAVATSNLDDSLKKQEQTLGAAVQGLSAQMERMTAEYMALRDSMAALEARSSRMEDKLERLDAAVRVMQAPAPPPSTEEAASGGAAGLP